MKDSSIIFLFSWSTTQLLLQGGPLMVLMIIFLSEFLPLFLFLTQMTLEIINRVCYLKRSTTGDSVNETQQQHRFRNPLLLFTLLPVGIFFSFSKLTPPKLLLRLPSPSSTFLQLTKLWSVKKKKKLFRCSDTSSSSGVNCVSTAFDTEV